MGKKIKLQTPEMLTEKLPLYEHYYRRIPRLRKKKNGSGRYKKEIASGVW